MATDPLVSRAKFAREVKPFEDERERYALMGIWVLYSEYPEILVAFATPKSPQVFVPFAALVDFTDYDALPLRVTLVHPCTRKPLNFSEVLPQVFPNIQFPVPGRINRLRLDNATGGQIIQDSLLQGYDNTDAKPFLCLPGVKSYHDHPGHTGDSWWLHRSLGEGSLHTILYTLWKYGTRNVTGQKMTISVTAAGYVVQPEFEAPVAAAPVPAQAPPTESQQDGGGM